MQTSQYDRRKFLGAGALMTAGLFVLPKIVFGAVRERAANGIFRNVQESPVTIIRRAAATAKINVTKLRGNLSMLEGSGGNILVLDGPDGKLLIDGGIDTSKVNLTAALDGISNRPVKYLVNTHWHFDHVDSNLWLRQSGATIMAHENTLKNMSKSTRVEDWDFTFPAADKDALPQKTFKSRDTLQCNGETVEMRYYPPAHTDSDISVYFPKADVLHVADTWWNGHFPFIDYSTGGSIKGMIEATKANLQNTTDRTIIVPGHGPLGDRKQLRAYSDMLVDVYAKISALKKQGKSIEEVLATNPTARYDSEYGTFVINGPFFTRLVYKGA